VACTIATNGIGRGGKVQLGGALPRNGASKSAPATAASKETDDTDLEEGSKLMDAGKYGEAIAYFGRSINHNPGQPFAYFDRAECEVHLPNYRKAAEDLTLAIQRYQNLNESDLNRV
jgi:tetratricopeptide (TPR) repeat protein